MKLTQTAITLILGSNSLMGRLMGLFERSERTIQLMIEKNDPRLHTDAAVNTICEETGLLPNQVLESSEVGVQDTAA